MSDNLMLDFSAADAPEDGKGIRDGFLKRCAREGCSCPVEPQTRGGDPKDYCSSSCQKRAWDERHGRVKPAAPTGEPYETARSWLLARLEEGPVSTLELRSPPWRASQNPAQRVLELRNRQYDIRTERRGKWTYYQLWKDGEPVGRLEDR